MGLNFGILISKLVVLAKQFLLMSFCHQLIGIGAQKSGCWNALGVLLNCYHYLMSKSCHINFIVFSILECCCRLGSAGALV